LSFRPSPFIPAKPGTKPFSTTKFTKAFVSFVNFVVPLQLAADLSWILRFRGDERNRGLGVGSR